MTTFPGSPPLVKGGIVLVDVQTSNINRIISLQYNPESISRSFQIKSIEGENGQRSEALRLTGPPIETINLDAEIDATDQLEHPDDHENTAKEGISPQLAALETIIYPAASKLIGNNQMANTGTLEIAPMETDLTLFIWSKNRITPVRITEFSITEDAFDANLNPIRAKVSLGMRVLTIDDLGFDHVGGSLYMSYQQNKERLSQMMSSGQLKDFGIKNIF
jgi:hypothetical protein